MFGSNFTAAQISIVQIIDLRSMLQYLGIPIWKKSFIFGDN
jgi:hypothetical protein